MQTTRIDKVLRDAAEAGEIPGVVAMAASAGKVVYTGAFGRRWLPDGPAMMPDSGFLIASMTKAITSTAAMILVQQGKLDLDGPLGTVMPELASPQVLDGFSAEGEPKLRPAKTPLTLRHLLTHTSGFGYDLWNPALRQYREIAGLPELFTCQNAALNLPLAFDPGARWEYGISIDWIGKVIERVSGQTLQAYFDEHLFGPLGMKDTGFKLTEEIRPRMARMHGRQDSGSLEQIPFELPQEPEFQMGGGGLHSTAPDYLAFLQMFLHGGDSVLRPQTIESICQNHIGNLAVTGLPPAMPFSNAAEFFPGMAKKWGLAFMINTEAVPGGRSANSQSWAGLFNTYYWVDLQRRVAGVMLMQVMPFFDAKAVTLFEQFEKAIYASL